MQNSNLLYLASSSKSRRFLLDQSKIPYKIINHFAEETLDLSLSLNEQVKQLAVKKMDHADLTNINEGKQIFVLTADTMARDESGILYGKPKNIKDAIKIIKTLNLQKIFVVTGYCIDVKVLINSKWICRERIVNSIGSECIISIPEDCISLYLENTDALHAAGAIIVEHFGMQFVKSVNGSYSTILGLPLFEVRLNLEKLGFFLSN